MTQAIIDIKHLKKSYGQNEVLKDISLSVTKVKLFRLSVHQVQENRHFFVLSTF